MDIDEIRKRRDSAQSAYAAHHERALDDLKMLRGDHYDEATRTAREAASRPCLTVNTLPQFVRAVTGQIRSMNPSIRVVAGDSSASKDTAELIEGLIRHIQNRSDASSVYEGAAESAAACSMGYFRIRTDYEDDVSFNQEILIERIFNSTSVFFDPSAKDPTRCDAQWCFVVEDMPVDEFKKAYPTAATEAFTSDHKPDWVVNWAAADTITVAEFFWIEHIEMEIGLTASGRVVEITEGVDRAQLTKIRKTKVPQCKWLKCTGAEIIEKARDFPSRYLPIIAVLGEEWHIGDESYISSVIRFAKDPAILYNYAVSTEAEVVAMQPLAPYVATAKQIAGNEASWAKANDPSVAVLVYNPDPQAGGRPQRETPPMASQGLLQTMASAAEDMKRTTGIYDAGLGARSNETSGKAIMARKEESQNSNSIYADRMVKAVMQAGKVILDMIPKVYDTARAIRILGEDGKEKMVRINDVVINDGIEQPVNDLTVGRYDVRIQVGPSYQTRRAENQDTLMEFLRAVPQAAAVVGDLIAKNLETDDADLIAERIRASMPPELVKADPSEMSPEDQARMQQQMLAAQEQQRMQAEMQAIAQREAKAKADKATADAAKAQAEAAKAQTELAIMNGKIEETVRQMVYEALHTPPPASVPA